MLHTNRYFRKRSIILIAVFVMSTALIITIYRWQQIPDDVIAFVSTREGTPGIYLITPDGDYLRRLTPNYCCSTNILSSFLHKIFPGLPTRTPLIVASRPFWSSNGQYIVYHDYYNGSLSIMDASGTNRELLSAANNPFFVAWYSDNSKVIYGERVSLTSDVSSFVLFASDGLQREQIPYKFEQHRPYLSPDLKRSAFWARGEVMDEQTPRFHICVSTVDNLEIACSSIRATDEPAWDPSSQAIAFSCGDLAFALCIMDINTNQTKEFALPSEIDYVVGMEWSPDNEKIAFVGAIQQPQDNPTITFDLYILDSGSSRLTRLTNHVAYDVDPSWSPDSSKIVFASMRNGNWDLYIINADGTGLTQLTDNERDDDQPAWRPAR